jgi:hypothetical protein
MVVSVDKAGQHHLTTGSEDRDPRVFRDQFGAAAGSVKMVRARMMLEGMGSLPMTS